MIVPRSEWERAAAGLTAEIDYPNFKNEVARCQGHQRAVLYGRVWSLLRSLQV